MVYLMVLLGYLSAYVGESEDSAPMSEIHFCHFEVAPHIKSMNAGFSVAYSFEVNDKGKPTEIKKLHDPFLQDSVVEQCVQEWYLPGLDSGTTGVLVSTWKHGLGWTEMAIKAGTLQQRIVRSGDLKPYSSEVKLPQSQRQNDPFDNEDSL